ncbi:MAG TPA: lysophospholipase [Myxococcales bacterium]|nr:lysophospholipase [Myxococcales bacterium]
MPDLPTDDGYFSARDGLRLFWRTTRPPAEPIAHVVVLHGYAEHLGRHAEITRALASGGYAAHSFDCRGHGQSGGKRAHVDAFDEYLLDLADFFAEVREKARGRPLFFLGHSHGALIGIRYLLDHPDAVRGAILASPYLRLKLRVSPIKVAAGKLLSRVLPSLPMRNDLKAEQLTRDVEIQNATRRDPLYQQIATPRWFTESSGAQETCLRRATEFVTPFLLLFGGADPIADPAAGREFFQHATSKDKQHKQYDGLLHELFHEPERDVVFRDVIGWLDERARRAQPRAATGEGG